MSVERQANKPITKIVRKQDLFRKTINMDKSEFEKRLQSIVIPGGTPQNDLVRILAPISEAITQMMPRSLFRFRTCSKMQIDAFKKDELYAVTADKFNDPYDTLVRYDKEGIKQSIASFLTCEALRQLKVFFEQGNDFPDEVKKILSRDVTDSIKNSLMLMPDDDSLKQYIEARKHQMLSLIDIYFPLLAEYSKRFQTIACLCESIESVVMWSHYAQNHQGFALEYNLRDTLAHPLKNVGIYPVIYNEERLDVSIYMVWGFLMMIGINSPIPDMLSSMKIALHKSKQWEYEKEWRLIDSTIRDYTSDEPSVIHIKPTAIYYGQRIAKEDKEKLHTIALEHGIREYDMYIDYSSPEYKMLNKPLQSK